MKKIIILSIVLAGFKLSANAQATTSANQNVGLSLSNALTITFVANSSANGATASIPFATVSDYVNGVESNLQNLKVQSNKKFNVTLNAASANFTYSGTASPAPTMPVTGVLTCDIENNNTGGTINTAYANETYGAISTTPVTLISNANNGNSQTFAVEYYAQPGFAYPAGTYTVNVIISATQP